MSRTVYAQWQHDAINAALRDESASGPLSTRILDALEQAAAHERDEMRADVEAYYGLGEAVSW